MMILIDAYNVLKQMAPTGHITSGQRTAFVRKIEQYVRHRGHSAYVVFDGSEVDAIRSSSTLHVIYAGAGRPADDVLKKLCQKFSHLETVVVSSDRDVCAFANLYGIACIDAHLLYELLSDRTEEAALHVMKSSGAAHKRPGHESSSETDILMQEAAEKLLIKSEDERVVRKKKAASLSKTEKKLKKLVNKL